ncbi:hypothetical protein [Kocuria rosea]|uniref:hypothetical protein n=1 Tax=Kocuria rosea TaxID=1275 RepID=UPI001643BF9E|nr:hypothetical protein [Kocuria rosea]
MTVTATRPHRSPLGAWVEPGEPFTPAPAEGPGEALAAAFTAALDRGTGPDDDYLFAFAEMPPEPVWHDISPAKRAWLATSYGYYLI